LRRDRFRDAVRDDTNPFRLITEVEKPWDLDAAHGDGMVHSRTDESMERVAMHLAGSSWTAVLRRYVGRMNAPGNQMPNDMRVYALGNDKSGLEFDQPKRAPQSRQIGAVAHPRTSHPNAAAKELVEKGALVDERQHTRVETMFAERRNQN
jgi:hypothetical protein